MESHSRRRSPSKHRICIKMQKYCKASNRTPDPAPMKQHFCFFSYSTFGNCCVMRLFCHSIVSFQLPTLVGSRVLRKLNIFFYHLNEGRRFLQRFSCWLFKHASKTFAWWLSLSITHRCLFIYFVREQSCRDRQKRKWLMTDYDLSIPGEG